MFIKKYFVLIFTLLAFVSCSDVEDKEKEIINKIKSAEKVKSDDNKNVYKFDKFGITEPDDEIVYKLEAKIDDREYQMYLDIRKMALNYNSDYTVTGFLYVKNNPKVYDCVDINPDIIKAFPIDGNIKNNDMTIYIGENFQENLNHKFNIDMSNDEIVLKGKFNIDDKVRLGEDIDYDKDIVFKQADNKINKVKIINKSFSNVYKIDDPTTEIKDDNEREVEITLSLSSAFVDSKDKNIDKLNSNLFVDFEKEFKKELSDLDDNNNDFDYVSRNNISQVSFFDDEIINFVKSTYVYSGGAHGNYGYNAEVYSLKTGEKIDYYSNMFINNDDIKLKEVIYTALLEKYTGEDAPAFLSSDPEGLGFRYYVSPNGITFHWDPYEIGPYAQGSFEVTVPFAKLIEFAKPDSPFYHLFKSSCPNKNSDK